MTDTIRPPVRVWGVARCSALLVAVLALGVGLSLSSMRAYAALVPVPTAQGPHLQLLSDPFPARFLNLSPGSVEQWQIQATLIDPQASLNVQFARSGALVTQPVDGLQVQVQRCDAEWTSVSTTPACSDSPQNVFGPAAASSLPVGPTIDLAGITKAKGKFLLVTLSIPDTAQARADKSLQGLTGTIDFGLTAREAAPVTPVVPTTPPVIPDDSLAFTGADALPLFLVAFGAIGLGVIVTGARKIRAATAERGDS